MMAFCVACRTMRQVMDTYETDTGDSRSDGAGLTTTYVAMPLECGHDANDGSRQPPPTIVGSPRRQQWLVDKVAELQEGMNR